MLPLILISAALVLIVYYFRRTFSYWERRKILSYPSPSLISGHSKTNLPAQMVAIYKYFSQKSSKHGGFYIFHQPIYMPLDLDLLRQIMAKDFDHFNEKGLYVNDRDQPIAAHLFSIGGSHWQRLRAKLTPTFSSGKMKTMFPTIVECAKPLISAIEKSTKQSQDINIKDIASKFTTDVIGSCAFGIDCNSFQDSGSDFHRNGIAWQTRTPLRSLKFALAMSFPKLCKAMGIVTIPREQEEFYTNITKETVKYREDNNIHRNDFLEILMALRDKTDPNERINLQEIINQSFVFYVAGFETSSTLMTFALLELSRNVNIQDKVREEVNATIKKYNNEFTYEAINAMKYLRQVVDETLRMYPPATMLNRECNKEYRIPGTDIVLEKGQKVFIPVLAIHHDATYYPEPEIFDPERFSDEAKKMRHPYAFLPFGEGPRQCIGLRFGYLEAKLGLATLLHKFKFTLHEKVQYPVEFDNGFIGTSLMNPIVLKSTFV